MQLQQKKKKNYFTEFSVIQEYEDITGPHEKALRKVM